MDRSFSVYNRGKKVFYDPEMVKNRGKPRYYLDFVKNRPIGKPTLILT